MRIVTFSANPDSAHAVSCKGLMVMAAKRQLYLVALLGHASAAPWLRLMTLRALEPMRSKDYVHKTVVDEH